MQEIVADGICKSKSESDTTFLHVPPDIVLNVQVLPSPNQKRVNKVSQNLVFVHILSLFRTKICGQIIGQSVYKFWTNFYSNKTTGHPGAGQKQDIIWTGLWTKIDSYSFSGPLHIELGKDCSTANL